jgi:hypothetical protein
MATSAERMGSLRERERRGLRRLTIGVSEDDLRVIAEHGYEDAASADQDQQAKAVSLFITDMLAASIGQGDGTPKIASWSRAGARSTPMRSEKRSGASRV